MKSIGMVLVSMTFLLTLGIALRLLALTWAFFLFSGEKKEVLTPLVIVGILVLLCIGCVRYWILSV
jgi:hypothetical protein